MPTTKKATQAETCGGRAPSTGGWQPNSTRDLGERRKMTRHIVHVLQNRQNMRRSHADATMSSSDLAQMAKKIELSLYRSAVNMEEYSNTSTLQKRINSLVRAFVIVSR
mmetsp:Transcript_7170/g.19987  ORF Transcript_7170/g.19987 Transcript_7170/m.19987 type:complete len:109 (-) Transcript_7170:169-495(-)